MADVTLLMGANFGNLSAVLSSNETIWHNRGYATTAIHAQDNTFYTEPVGQEADFGETVRFRMRKRGGKYYKTWLKISISAGVLKAGYEAVYSDDVAQLLLNTVRMSYASKDIQVYTGEFIKAYMRLMEHDIFREAYNARNLAGLPPGGAYETIRRGNTVAAIDLYPALDWLYFTRSEDYSLHPEALASELDLEITYAQLQRVVYSRVTATGLTPVVTPFSTAPSITSTRLFQQLIFNPVPEKNLALKSYEKEHGNIFKILDVERQLGNSIPLAAGTYSIKLDNIRLDSQFIMFFMRDSLVNTDWAVDNMQSDTTATVLTGGGSVAALQSITSFRLLANGGEIIRSTNDVENRCIWRDIYLKGSQIAEPIYFIPWSWLLKDAKNVTSFQNMANLGSVTLEVTVPVRSRTSVLDVYSVCHNIVQWKRGDVVKSLR